MNKIAFISGWYSFNGHSGIHEDNKFILNCLYNSAKKYFFKDSNVDFIFITNDKNIELENVKNIYIDYDVNGFWHMCLMKILSLKYINDSYDYIFVHDTDQIYVNPINEDFLDNDFYLLHHYFYGSLKGVHNDVTDRVPLNFNPTDEYWTMGNFFGGKTELIKQLSEFTEQQHNLYVSDTYHPDHHFYSRYPEELFLLKFIFEKNIRHKRLHSTAHPESIENDWFLGNFKEDKLIYQNIPKVKLIHNTKSNITLLKEIIKYHI